MKLIADPRRCACAPPPPAAAPRTETAVLAGGCFWGMESVFEHVKGVTDVVSGYAGGSAADANYDEVSSEGTGHAEAVRITYDPAQISYAQLLQIYFTVAHDPTQVNRQGPDVGHSYRSAIFPQTPEQARFAKAFIARLNAAHVYKAPIATQDRKRRLLPGRGLSPGLRAQAPVLSLYRRQRPAEGRRAAQEISRALQGVRPLSR